jgi:hypothetical protein
LRSGDPPGHERWLHMGEVLAPIPRLPRYDVKGGRSTEQRIRDAVVAVAETRAIRGDAQQTRARVADTSSVLRRHHREGVAGIHAGGDGRQIGGLRLCAPRPFRPQTSGRWPGSPLAVNLRKNRGRLVRSAMAMDGDRSQVEEGWSPGSPCRVLGGVEPRCERWVHHCIGDRHRVGWGVRQHDAGDEHDDPGDEGGHPGDEHHPRTVAWSGWGCRRRGEQCCHASSLHPSTLACIGRTPHFCRGGHGQAGVGRIP